MTATLISLISVMAGILGANLIGFVYKKYTFGLVGNTIAGVFGGVLLIKSFGRLGFDPTSIIESGNTSWLLFLLNILTSFSGGVGSVILIKRLQEKMASSNKKNLKVGLKQATIGDIKELQGICTKSYSEVFADHWNKNGLEVYLEGQFGSARLKSDLQDVDTEYFFILKGKEKVGFLKVNFRSLDDLSELDNCELEKIYILPAYSGKGIGKLAMTETIDRLKKRGKELVFLCVIDTNESAIAFYEKLGFKFHSKTRLEIAHFKEELRGMNRMCLKLN